MLVNKEQYFREEHFATFDSPKPDLDDLPTQRERLNVREALLWIGEQLWPFIQSKGWDLHRHRQKEHFASSYHFVFDQGKPIVNQIGSMWLHYGKSVQQLDGLKTFGGFDYRSKDVEEFYNAFYLHTRIQIYISNSVIRCWLMLATDKNYYDRSEFLKKIRNSEAFRNKVWKQIQSLMDKEFFYEIDDKRIEIKQDLDRKSFFKFVCTDKGGLYSGIVKEYDPNDSRISRDNIVDEMKGNFDLLYPMYDLFAYRIINIETKKPDLTKLFGGTARVTCR